MNIGFIEDTHLHGGTQLWAVEAMKAFIDRGHEVTLLAPADSWIVEQCQAVKAAVFTYEWNDVVGESGDNIICCIVSSGLITQKYHISS